MNPPAAARARSGMAVYARLLGHARRYGPVALVAVLAMIVDAACMGVFAGSIKPMLDNLFIARDPQTIFWMPIVIVAIFLLRSIAIYVTDFGMAYIGRVAKYTISASEIAAINCTRALAMPLVEATLRPSLRVCSETRLKRPDS